MSRMTVYIPEISDVAEFVNIMASCPYEAQLTVGSYSVDAKSIMGIFTLDRCQPVELDVETSDSNEVAKLSGALKKFLRQPMQS